MANPPENVLASNSYFSVDSDWDWTERRPVFDFGYYEDALH